MFFWCSFEREIFLPYHRWTQTCLRKVQVWKFKKLGSSWLTTSCVCKTNHFTFICSETGATIKWRCCLTGSLRHGSLFQRSATTDATKINWSSVGEYHGYIAIGSRKSASLQALIMWAWWLMMVMEVSCALGTSRHMVQLIVDLESLELRILIYRVPKLSLKF